MPKNKFVLSASEYNSIKEAEAKIEEWQEEEDLKSGTKLYKVVEIYDLKLKFVKRKAVKK